MDACQQHASQLLEDQPDNEDAAIMLAEIMAHQVCHQCHGVGSADPHGQQLSLGAQGASCTRSMWQATSGRLLGSCGKGCMSLCTYTRGVHWQWVVVATRLCVHLAATM